MQIIYVKVMVPALPEAVRTSIYSVMVEGTYTPERKLAKIRRQAAIRKVHAIYELTTREEYVAFRESQKTHIADKAQAVARELHS